MSMEPSSKSNNATPPSSSSSVDSFIGSYISVMSKADIRYEGILYYLNPKDSTFGLKDVRSFGSEGRRTDGQEVPPSNKIFEYILFRGSDIKDLIVITNQPVQQQDKIYNDPAIIESNYRVLLPPSSTSNSVSASPGYSTESNLYTEPSALNVTSYSSMLPSLPSGSQMELGYSQLKHSAESSYDTPTQWQGYGEGPGSIAVSQQQSFSLSTPILYPSQNQAPTDIAVTKISYNVPSGFPHVTSSSICSTLPANHTSEKLSMPFIDSPPLKQNQHFNNSISINSKGLTQPVPVTYQNAGRIEAQAVKEVTLDPVSSLPVQFLPNSTSSISGQISNSSLGRENYFLPPNLSQPILSEHSLSNNLFADQKDAYAIGSTSLNFVSSATIPAVQQPLLPLPPTSQKLQSPLQFTEEFDFEAMNEKFKKDEVWGYLGQANQRENVDRMQNATDSLEFGDGNPDLISKSDAAKPAYNKDDFFDTISCNSLGRGARDGQNRLSERVKLNTETFGTFQRTQLGYGGQRAGYRGPNNWGRGYNYGYRGSGRYM